MTTIDFPTIEDIPVTRTEVATAAVQAIDIATVNLTDLALAKFGPWREQAKTAKAEFAALVLDLGTQKAIDDAVSLRNRKVKQPLADARKTAKALKSKLAETSEAVGDELPLIEAGWADVASAITPRIEAAQKALDDAKAEAARLEAERLAGLRAKIDECMAGWLARCGAEGITAERVAAGIGMLGNMTMPIDAGLEDVADHWTSAKLLTMGKMENIRLGLARKELQAQQDALRADQARVAAITKRITEIHAAASGHERADSWAIFEAIVVVEALAVGADVYQELAPLAEAARASTLAALRAKHTTAVEREAEQAKLQAARDAEALAAKNSTQLAPTGEGKAVTPGACNAEAAPNNELMGGLAPSLNGWPGNQGTEAAPHKTGPAATEYRENSGRDDGGERPAPIPEAQVTQQVLKAEPAMADATDRVEPAITSPPVGAMGAGQAADTAPVADRTMTLCREALAMLSPDGDMLRWTVAHTDALRQAVEVLAARLEIAG